CTFVCLLVKNTIRMKKIILLISFLLFILTLKAQEKKYKVALVGFYNLENFFDTIEDVTKHDREFLPNGPYHYTSEVYHDKVRHLATVISQIGTEFSADGLCMMGCAEVENESVMKDLIHDSLLVNRHYSIVHYDSPDERGIDVGFIYNP